MGLKPGEVFGPYTVIGPLGRGGMATVYKCYESALDRHIALKVLPGEFLHDDTFSERFRREAKVIAKLEHPNIVPIFAFGIEQNIPWMAMRLVAGGSVSGKERSGEGIGASATRIIRGVAEALDYAHGKGVVHRDVKPQNILLDDDGRVYLADFGIAKMIEGSGGLTQAGMISGTPQYMAPEQARGETIDSRSDIYALGVVAYELLTGRVPFSADTPVAVLMKHITDPVPVPSPTDVPAAAANVLVKALAKKPADRWPTARAFADAIEDALRASPTVPGTIAIMAGATTPLPGLMGATTGMPFADPTVPVAPVPPPPPPPRTPTLPPMPPPSTAPQPQVDQTAPKRASSTGVLVAGGAAIAALGLVVLGGIGWYVMGRTPAATTADQSLADASPVPATTPFPEPATPDPSQVAPPAVVEPGEGPPGTPAPTEPMPVPARTPRPESTVAPAPTTLPVATPPPAPGPPAPLEPRVVQTEKSFQRTVPFAVGTPLALGGRIGPVRVMEVRFKMRPGPAGRFKKLIKRGAAAQVVTVSAQCDFLLDEDAPDWDLDVKFDLLDGAGKVVGQLTANENIEDEKYTISLESEMAAEAFESVKAARLRLDGEPG